MTIRVTRVESLADCDRCRAIAASVWGADAACSTPEMSVHAKYGGVVLLAWDDDRPVGFLFSFPARYRGEWVLWSHETGVLPEYLHRGVGSMLKFTQRDQAREMGYSTIAWTYDPLVARNAHFNLNKLGARLVEYKVNAYGSDDGDLVNRGLETDRFIAVWSTDGGSDAGTPGSGQATAQRVVSEDPADGVAANEGPTLLAVGADRLPKMSESGSASASAYESDWVGADGKDRGAAMAMLGVDRMFTEIPIAWDGMAFEIRVHWRHAFRTVALALFGAGWAPVAFERGADVGRYVWRKADRGCPDRKE